NLAFADVAARVSYENGVLRLDDLRGGVPNPGGPAGTFAGQAQYQYLPQGDLTARLALTPVPLKQVSQLDPRLAGIFDGAVSGHVQARVTQGTLRDVNAWDVTGNVSSPHAAGYGLSLDEFSAGLRATRGVATLSDLRGKLAGSPVTGTA